MSILADDITSKWVGGSFAWAVDANWDMGIPDNSGGNNYTAVIDLENARVIPTVPGLQITNLQLLRGQLEATSSIASFSVLNETTINPAKVVSFFSEQPAAIFKITTTGANKVTFNLGTFNGDMNGTLTGGRYELTSRSSTSEAFVAWKGAALQTIGPDAEVLLNDIGPSGFRNADDNSDALAGVARNEGTFKLQDRGFAFSGSFTNAGDFAINESLTIGATTDPVKFTTAGNFNNTGTAKVQSNSSNTTYSIGGDFINSGVMDFYLNNQFGDPLTLTPEFKGDLFNSGSLVMAANSLEANWQVDGEIANTGVLRLDSYAADFTLHAKGGFAGFQNGTLPSGIFQLYSRQPASEVNLLTEGLDITTIGADAGIELHGPGTSVMNNVSGMSALKNLEVVDGSLFIQGQSWTFSEAFSNRGSFDFWTTNEYGQQTLTFGNLFSNTGTLTLFAFNSIGETGGESLASLSGGLAENSGGVLSAGYLAVDADRDATAILEWPGARIESIGANAGIFLVGPNSIIRDQSNQQDALDNLESNSGLLSFLLRDASVPGDLQNASGTDIPAELAVADSTLSIAGAFSNSGKVEITGEEKNASITTGAGLSNTGEVEISALEHDATFSIAGPLAEQVGSELQAGTYTFYSDSTNTALFEYEGASIHTIAADAGIKLNGPNSILRDKTTMTDALESITNVQGSLALYDGKSRVFSGNLEVGGTLELGSANYRVSGNFTNPGVTLFNLGGSPGNQLIIDGEFSSPGELYIYNGGILTTNSAFGQQSGSTLTDVDLYLFGGIAKWSDAEITQIGPDGGLGLAGAGGIQKLGTDEDALVGLISNEGFFFLEDFSFNFSGDFYNSGEMELGIDATLNLPGGAVLSSNSDFENGGNNTITGGKLQLLDGGTFTTWDIFKEYGPNFTPIFEFATLTAPEIEIDGDLHLEVYDLIPETGMEYVIIESSAITGAFDNVAFGGRINLFDGNFPDGERLIGTLTLNLDEENGRIFLSNFESAGPPTITITGLEMSGNQCSLDWTV
ncbi:MAG: hypothetical protein KJT03_09295, partial [Verrucomicrobiae bacterium]|nr:hypothetical protein [Verrucomicrobiae bacterium]